MNQLCRLILVPLLLTLLLAACGGDGSSSTSQNTTSSTTSGTSTGQVVDAPVANLNYVCGANSGTTDSMGYFSYVTGSTCTFSIGNIQIGRSIIVPSDGIVTPYDLAFVSRQDSSHVRAIFIARFLQSIDSGAVPGVITISPAVVANLSAATVAKTDNSFWLNTINEDQLAQLVNKAHGSNKTVVSASKALETLISTITSKGIKTSLGASSLLYKGFNLSGAEYAPQTIPGVYGKDYMFPPGTGWQSTAELPFYKSIGSNIVRLPFLWERLQQGLTNTSTGNEAFDSTYFNYLSSAITALKAQGFTVILDPHNYARYPSYPTTGSSNIIGTGTSPTGAAFANFWKKLATLYANDPQVIFNLMNEPNTMSTSAWVAIANPAIAAIRSTGAKNLILVPGNFWTGAWTWTTSTDSSGSASSTNAVAMLGITDSANNFAYDAHQYLDSDGSGTTNSCVGPNTSGITAGVARLSTFTAWLNANGKKAFLGEFGGGNPWVGASDPSNATCATAVKDMLNYLNANANVWIGWTWWTGGPWSTSATYRVEPDYTSSSYTTESTTGYLLPWLTPYLQ